MTEATTSTSDIQDWFSSRNVTVLNLSVPDERSLLLGDIAAAAATSEVCAKLVKTLAYAMQKRQGRPIFISRKDLTDHEVGAVRKFANQLAEVGMVARVFKAENAAVGVNPLKRTQANGLFFDEMSAFLSGGWFEHHALGVAHQVFGEGASLAHNVLLEQPGGQQVEIDLFALVNGEPVWVECKSGRRYQSHLPKYGTFAKTLGIHPDRSILMARDVNPEKSRKIGLVHGLTVTDGAGLADALTAAVAGEKAASASEAAENLSLAAEKANKAETSGAVSAGAQGGGGAAEKPPTPKPKAGFFRRLFGR